MKRLISLALVVALVVCLMAVPASAASFENNGYGYNIVTPNSPTRDYNDDGTVKLTYNLLDPGGCWYLGNGDEMTLFNSSGVLSFTQNVGVSESHTFEGGISFFDYYGRGQYSTLTQYDTGETIYTVFVSDTYGGNSVYLDSWKDYTAVLLGGVVYPCELQIAYSSLGNESYAYFGNPALFRTSSTKCHYDADGNALEDNGLPFLIQAGADGSASTTFFTTDLSLVGSSEACCSLGLLETVVEESSEYTNGQFYMYPLGYEFTSPNEIGERSVLNLTKLRSGYGYDLTFDVDLSIEMSDATALTQVYLNIFYQDSNGNALSAFSSDYFTVTDGYCNLTCLTTVPSSAAYVYISLNARDLMVDGLEYCSIECTKCDLSFDVTAAENSDLVQKEENSQIIDELGGKLDDVNQNLDDIEDAVNDGLGDVSDKLDDVNGNLDDVENAVGDVADKVEESNTWLENISEGITSLPQKIGEMITGLFVPDADGMAEQQDKWNQLLVDHFGAVYESVEIMDEVAAAFSIQDVQEKIEFPSVTVPLSGVDFELGGWMVDVVPDGFEFLIEVLKKIIDILCTFAFVTAMRNRLEKILGGAA